MSDAIRVSLTPETLQVLPAGEAVETVVTIQNTGSAVDQYAVELDGLPTTWYSLSNSSVALFPQDKDEAKIVIRPPKGGNVKAGAYPFTVTVLSRADATETSRVEGTLEIGAVAAFDLDMSPKKVIGRRGRYNLTMRNGGNADIDVALEALDADEGCRYAFKPDAPHLGPGQQVPVRLTVRPRRSNWVGGRKQFDFQVKAKPSAGDPKQLQGQLVHTPHFRTWKPLRRLIALLVLIAALLIAMAAMGGPDGVAAKARQWGTQFSQFACQRVHLLCSPPAHPGHYAYIGAFRAFHAHRPGLLGQPVENEHHPIAGYSVQKTTNGLLVFDQQDGRVYFIPNGDHVYVYDGTAAHRIR